MDFKDQLKQLGERITKLKESTQTEEATKTAFIMPFLQALGYDVFNPTEIVPEYTCDVGIKEGEKIDYAVFKDGKPIILIECKHWKQNLSLHKGQLLRYFNVSEASFGILTNGIEYLFYSDLSEPNKMDEKPFLELNMENIKDNVIEEVKKFHKSYFELDSVLSTASELKYMKDLRAIIKSEMNSPSEDFVKLLAKQVYPSSITKKQLDFFTDLIKRTFSHTINELVSDRLKAALDSEKQAEKQAEVEAQAAQPIPEEDNNGIVTTEEELDGFRIVKAILRKNISPDRVFYRDTINYFNILLDDNIRKTVCRLYFNNPNKKYIMLHVGQEDETKIEVKNLDDIYNHSEELIKIALAHTNKKAE